MNDKLEIRIPNDFYKNQSINIAFEGVDGSGKTSCLMQFKDLLEQSKIIPEHNIYVFKEDVDFTGCRTPQARLYEVLKKREMMLDLFGDKFQDKKNIILLDRFKRSTLVYQGVIGGIPINEIEDLLERHLCGKYPVYDIFIHAPDHVVSERLKKKVKESGVDPKKVEYESMSIEAVHRFQTAFSNYYLSKLGLHSNPLLFVVENVKKMYQDPYIRLLVEKLEQAYQYKN